MKKTLVFLGIALFVALFAISCNSTPSATTEENLSDEAVVEEPAVEEEVVEDKALTDGKWVNDEWGSVSSYQFNADGTCRHIYEGSDSDFNTDETGTYTVDGENLKIEVKGDNFSVTTNMTFKIKGNTLTLTEAGVPMDYKWQTAE